MVCKIHIEVQDIEDQEMSVECSAASTASAFSPIRDRSPLDSGGLADTSTDGDLGDDDDFNPMTSSRYSTLGGGEVSNSATIQTNGRARGIMMRLGGRGKDRGRGRGRKRGRGSNKKQKSKFIGPLTYQDTIMSAPWEKEEGNNIVHTFSEPQPGPVQPISSDANAIDLFL